MVLVRLFTRCTMDMVSSIVFIPCPSLRTCSENLDLASAYQISLLCSLNLVLKFLLVFPIKFFFAILSCDDIIE